MNYVTWISINVPVGSFSFLMNAFYIFCMVRLHRGDRIKQPLKSLLAFLIVSMLIYLMSVSGLFFSEENDENDRITQILLLITVCCLSTSISSSVWLNFFYYTQIVPAQRAFFIWIKKNIRPIIFCILFIETIYALLNFILVLLNVNLHGSALNDSFSMDHTFMYVPVKGFMNPDMNLFLLIIQKVHFYFNFAVMMMSSGVTVIYLCKHMRRMVANGQPLSCPRFSSQVRVTVTGILQGLLYLSFAVWQEFTFITLDFNSQLISPYICSTIINFYMFGTAFNLGTGQAVFRQRVADIWTRTARWWRGHNNSAAGAGSVRSKTVVENTNQ